jgi:hypothetical protein
VKDEKGETLCQSHLADQQLHQMLEKVDAHLAQETAQADCLYYNEKLHRADYVVSNIDYETVVEIREQVEYELREEGKID